ncbi:MAG TPA: lytic transglycosylase domain-containing protein [Thermoanaerobaculia bacterium]|nr:lytic transglycosylase domain-containing protein [Thermoanaerobaculia bacterium]
MPRKLLSPLALLALLAGAALPRPAAAELVVLGGGQVLKVKGYEVAGEQVRLVLLSGGRMTLPLARVAHIVDDEVLPVPEPAPEASAAAEAGLALLFQEGQEVPAETPYADLIVAAARKHGVNPQIVAALIRAESAFRPRAVSHKGARGLMQLMPATARRFGVETKELFHPERNLEAGIAYLRWLMDRFPNDLPRVLAAYNAGEGAVERYKGVPPYRETREYVRRIFGTLGLEQPKA